MRYFLELTEEETVSVELAGMGFVAWAGEDYVYLQSPSIQEAHNERSRQDIRDLSPVQE